MGIFNILVSIAVCITMTATLPEPSGKPTTGTTQTQQAANPATAAQRSTAPHTTPASEATTPNTETKPEQASPAPTPTAPPIHHDTATTGAPAGSPTAPLTSTTPTAPAAPLDNNATGPHNQAGTAHNNAIGAQDGTCTPTSGTWGTPANDTLVRRVPDRDPSTVQWEIDTQCTLTIKGGTTPNYSSDNIPWYSYRSTITKIHIDGNITLHTTSHTGAFQDMPALREVQIDGTLHLSQTAACNLFSVDSALTAFTGNGTAAIETSQATSMNSMFFCCSKLTALDVTHFNTTNTTSMNWMFAGCSALTTLDLSNFTTTNTTDMSDMFRGCSSLTALDVTHLDTTNTTDMNSMFQGCSKLTALDLSNFTTTKTTNMRGMFSGCSGLTALDVTHFNTANTTDMGWMFYACRGLTALDVSSFTTTKTTDMSAMFNGCRGLTALDVTHFNTANTTDMNWMFRDCSSLTALDVTHFTTTNTTGMSDMFRDCSSLTALDVTRFNTTKTTGMSSMFQGCSKLTALDLSNFTTTKTTNMSSMFQGCSKLTALDLSNFTTTKTTNMSSMFQGCSKLTALDVSSFNTTKTTNMYAMFSACSQLRELRLGPSTYLAATATDTSARLSPDTGWVELTAPGGPAPVTSMRARTARDCGHSPEGHYARATLTVTVDYNNGQADHTQTLTPATSATGTQHIDWGTRPAPAGKVFDGWTFATSDPTHVTLANNTVTWTNLGTPGATATLTATWRTLGTPALNLKVHADGTPNPDGTPGPWVEVSGTRPAGSASGDTVRIESANGAGRTADCTPAAGTNTCTVRLTVAQLRDPANYDAPYRIKASIRATDHRDTDTLVTGAPADKQGILPYTTINYQPGTGTGTPPPSTKALTDTDSRTARLTIAGPSPITRPAHSLFTTWRSGNGTDVHAGTTPVPASLGDTDPQGRTTINLTAQWTLLDAPAGITATRNPADNSVTISGTAKPRNNTDTIHICHPAPNGGTQCHDTTTDTTDTNGNRLPYDGTTEHPWHITLPATTPDGDWTTDTTLTTNDTAYPTASQQVDSPTTHTNVHIPTPYTSTLPLTGGNNRPALLLTAALAAATLLITAATRLRNHRRKAHHPAHQAQAGTVN